MSKKLSIQICETVEGRRFWAEEGIVIVFTKLVVQLMMDFRVSEEELAKRIGISVDKLKRRLAFEEDFSLREAGVILAALNADPVITAKRTRRYVKGIV